MPADANIFQQYLQQPKSVLDYQNQYNDADTKRNALQQSVLALQKGQMDMANAADVSRQRNALRDAITSGQIDLSNPDHAPRALALAPDVAPAMLKTVQEGATSRAKAGLDTAQAGHATAQTDAETFKTRVAKSDQAIKDISGFQTPQEALASLEQHASAGDIPQEQAQIIRQQLATMNPADFPKWQLGMVQNIMTAKDRMEYMAPNANTVATNKVSRDNNADTNKTHLTGIGIQQAGENSRNRATIAKDYNVAGLNPDGTPSTANDSMVDAIGQYKVAPPNGMALRNPRMQQILADVTAKYPDFDATQYGARQGAAKSFSTGKDGQAVQSANTALNHLGTLRELAAAQDNGNIRLFNQIANRFATETGGAAPSNLAAAVTMVGPEISKAVIGVGGGQGDREKVDAALSALTKGGKGQAAGTLATMEDLFGGRLTEAQRTYERTTGRKDFPTTFLSPAAQKVLSARAAPAAPAATAPALGTVKDGYRFKGGNPADPHSWEKQ